MLKAIRNGLFSLVVAAFVGFGLSLMGVPGSAVMPVVALVGVLWMLLLNYRSVTKVSPEDRARTLAEEPPAGYGLIYVHREKTVGGFAVAFDVELDHVMMTRLMTGSFTRIVAAPGSHLLTTGPKRVFGQIALPNQATHRFALSAGETVVFRMAIKPGKSGKIQPDLEVIRDPDAEQGLAKLAKDTMIALEKNWTALEASAA